MKLRKMVSRVLKALGYVIGIIGIFFALGSVGALETGSITCGQFIIYEITAGVIIALAFIVYIFRDLFNYKYIENFNINRKGE